MYSYMYSDAPLIGSTIGNLLIDLIIKSVILLFALYFGDKICPIPVRLRFNVLLAEVMLNLIGQYKKSDNG